GKRQVGADATALRVSGGCALQGRGQHRGCRQFRLRAPIEQPPLGGQRRKPMPPLEPPHTRRRLLATAAWGGAIAALRPLRALAAQAAPKVFDVTRYGAAGNGATLDTAAIQRAIDAAADAAASGTKAQVLLPGGRKFLTGTLRLKGTIDFHL